MTEPLLPSRRYEHALEVAAAIAAAEGSEWIGVEHLLVAIIRDREALATKLLGSKVDLDELERLLTEYGIHFAETFVRGLGGDVGGS